MAILIAVLVEMLSLTRILHLVCLSHLLVPVTFLDLLFCFWSRFSLQNSVLILV